MRGERLMVTTNRRMYDGSSPHARGTLRRREIEIEEDRFIPACAGNARASLFQWAGMSVHPRMRGERYPALESVSRAPGSSPHARGTHQNDVTDRGIYRFIPACAGNAGLLHLRRRAVTVHPRMRGERRVTADSISG